MRKYLVFLFLIVVCSFTLKAWAQGKSYSFGIAPIYNPQVIEEGFKPIMRYLSESLKAPIKLVIIESYDELTEKLKSGEMDFALLGPVLYIQTKGKYPELVYMATSQTTKFGKKRAYYFGHIISHKDSGIKDIAALENKSFAFVNKQTTSGYRFPMVYFYNQGINPKEYFSKIIFSGTHEKAVDMLAEKLVDATTTHDINLWTAEEKHGKIFKTLFKIGPIVNMALVAGHRVPQDIRLKFEEAMINLPKEVIPEKFPYDGFQVLSDNSYDNVREIINFPFEDYFLPDSLQSAIKSGDLNQVFRTLDNLKFNKEKTYKILNDRLSNKTFQLTGTVTGIKTNVPFGNGWYSLEKALVLNINDDRRAYIRLRRENADELRPNDTATFRGKVIGTKDLDSVVLESPRRK